MNRRRIVVVIASIAIASVSIAIFLYYFFMSAWVYVDVTTEMASPVRPTPLSSEDVTRHPVLQQKIHEAIEHWSNPETTYGPIRASFFEGKAIENLVGSSGRILTGNDFYRLEIIEAYFNYDGRDYRLIIDYRY